MACVIALDLGCGSENPFTLDEKQAFVVRFDRFDDLATWDTAGASVAEGELILTSTVRDDAKANPPADFESLSAVRVDTRWLEGSGEFGIEAPGFRRTFRGYGIRVQPAEGAEYQFRIAKAGHFAVARTDDSQETEFIRPWTETAVIRESGLNRIQIDLTASHYELWINDRIVSEIPRIDFDFATVGLFVLGAQEVAFDNFVVQ